MKKCKNEAESELYETILRELLQYRATELGIVYWIDGFGWTWTPLMQVFDFRDDCPHACFKKELIEDARAEFEIRRVRIS